MKSAGASGGLRVVALRTRLLIENRALERRHDLLGERDHATATKVWLDGPLEHTWLADLMLRVSEANQLGLLGFGGDRGSYHAGRGKRRCVGH